MNVYIWFWIYFTVLGCPFYLVNGSSALPPEIAIGVIFKSDDRHLWKALNDILDRINNDKKILPRTNLTLKTEFIIGHDNFRAAKAICQMFKEQKIWLILTSKSDSVNRFARSIADMFHIPHLAIQWDYQSPYMDNINFPKKKNHNFNNLNSFDPASNLIRGQNGGYYLAGNAETGFRFQDQKDKNRKPRSFDYSQSDSLSRIKHLTLNIYPDATELSEALKDFIDSKNWKSFTLIYDSNDGLIKCKDLLTLANYAKPGRPKMKVSVLNFVEFDEMSRLQSKINQRLKRRKRQYVYDNSYYHRNRYKPYEPTAERLNPAELEELMNSYVYVKLWKEIKSSEHNFVLALKKERVVSFLREANKLKRMSEYDNYFIVTMDIHTFNLTQFQYLEPLPNITALSFVSEKGGQIYLGDRDQYYARGGLYSPFDSSFIPSSSSNGLPLSSYYGTKKTSYEALIYDAMTLFARALDDLDRSQPELISEPFVSCDLENNPNQRPWQLGIHIIDYMKNLKLKGITGLLLFNDLGMRVNFTLDVLQLKSNGLKNVAKWTREFGIKSLDNYTFYDSYKEILEAMKFKELLITVPPSSIPYISLKENHENLIGNDKYYGYCVDLLQEIANVFRQDFQSDFKYIIQVAPDGQYGRLDKETGEWNGMFGELIRHHADLAIADLTATYLRETAVDFTMPFMNLGITILFKKPSAPEPEMFSFLKPFSVEVWLYLASAFLGISLLLWILSRVSPYEWQAPHSCDPDPMELVNQFSIGNSLWFTIGSLMQQGSDFAPRALSTRTLATIWWFFTLIIISSYTANLAASLTLSRMAPAISSAEDLAKQTAILYGCRRGGSTHEFFANSNNSMYQRMYNTMESNPEVYIDKINDAIERVRKGGYAYLAESSSIEYQIQRRCDLIQIGNWLDNKGYGIATPPDSPYRTPISNAITVLQDRGILYELKQRWWVKKGGGLCTEDAKVSAASELEIENVGGVFLVLALGVAIGMLCGFIEFIWKSLKIARDERESIGKLIWLEMFRICTGGSSSRPVIQSSPSTINMTALDGSNLPRNSSSNRPFIKTSSFNSMAQFDNKDYYLPPPPDVAGGYSPEYDAINMRIRSPNIGTNNPNIVENTNADSHTSLLSSTKSLNNGRPSKNNFGSPTSFKSQQPYNNHYF